MSSPTELTPPASSAPTKALPTESITIEWLADALALVRLPPSTATPSWSAGPGFMSMTRSEQELSIVASLSCVPHDQPYEGPFRAARVRGQLPLNLVGVLVRIAGPLAAANVPIFAVSTFDTDYILVRADDRSRATQAWRAVGFDVVDSGATP